MARHPRRDTLPELALRHRLHARGLRYRVDERPIAALRRRADVVFRGPRLAVFVDGCYWHGCPSHCRPSGKNVEWWVRKIEGNRVRDRETDSILSGAGWTVLRVWAHEDPEVAAVRVELAVVNAKRPRRGKATGGDVRPEGSGDNRQ